MPGSRPCRAGSPLLVLFALTSASAHAQAPAPAPAEKPFKVGVVTFLSGAAAGPFGVPARNAAEVIVESLNNGKVPSPYGKKGLGGRPLEAVFIDEAGGTAKQVSEYRDLVQDEHDFDPIRNHPHFQALTSVIV